MLQLRQFKTIVIGLLESRGNAPLMRRKNVARKEHRRPFGSVNGPQANEWSVCPPMERDGCNWLKLVSAVQMAVHRQFTTCMCCLSCAVHNPSIVHQQSADEMLESTSWTDGLPNSCSFVWLRGWPQRERSCVALAPRRQSLGPPPNLANCSQTNTLASLRHCLSPLPLGVPFDPSLYPLGSLAGINRAPLAVD